MSKRKGSESLHNEERPVQRKRLNGRENILTVAELPNRLIQQSENDASELAGPCDYWLKTNNSGHIKHQRKRLYQQLMQAIGDSDQFLHHATGVQWTNLVRDMFKKYDATVLQGRLADHFERSNVTIQVMIDGIASLAKPTTSSSSTLQHRLPAAFTLELRRLDLINHQLPIEVHGVMCHDWLEVLQVELEHIIATLLAHTVCTLAIQVTRTFAQQLFGHTLAPKPAALLKNVPSSVMRLIAGNWLAPSDIISLASTNRHFNQDLVNVSVEQNPVDIAHILDRENGFRRFPHLIGKFRNVVVNDEAFLPHLPTGIRRLQINCDSTLKDFQVPTSLTHLTFGKDFNQPIEHLRLPASLIYLEFGDYFTQHVQNLSLPDSLIHLKIGLHSKSPLMRLDHLGSLTHLTLYQFSQPVEKLVLPACLTHLTFGSFNKPVDGLKLPSSLQELTFGEDFNRKVDQLRLPSGLKYLKFGNGFNQPVERLRLPSGLLCLGFGYEFNQPVNELNLPSSLKELTFGSHFDGHGEKLILPNGPTYVGFWGRFNKPVNKLKLPSTLEHLMFGRAFSKSLPKLPNSLTHLDVGGFNKPVDTLVLPKALKQLHFGGKFNQDVSHLDLPPTMTHLTFGPEFNQPVDRLKLPPTLTYLKFGYRFNQPFDQVVLPSMLQHLDFVDRDWGSEFEHPITIDQLPASLTWLEVKETYEPNFNVFLAWCEASKKR